MIAYTGTFAITEAPMRFSGNTVELAINSG